MNYQSNQISIIETQNGKTEKRIKSKKKENRNMENKSICIQVEHPHVF